MQTSPLVLLILGKLANWLTCPVPRFNPTPDPLPSFLTKNVVPPY